MTGKAPRSAGQLAKSVLAYARARGIAEKRVRDWISYMALGGALEQAAEAKGEGSRFTFRGGVVMELRRRGAARATKDLDLTYDGPDAELVAAVESALAAPYGRFTFRRAGLPREMTNIATIRMEIAVRFDGAAWGTVTIDVGPREAHALEIELVPAFDLSADFGIEGPERLPCLSARYHLAHKLHGMTARLASTSSRIDGNIHGRRDSSRRQPGLIDSRSWPPISSWRPKTSRRLRRRCERSAQRSTRPRTTEQTSRPI